VHGGWQLGRAALAAHRSLQGGADEQDFLRAKIATARFFADQALTQVDGLAESIVDGAAGVLALDEAHF
jgi:hypothetical protein